MATDFGSYLLESMSPEQQAAFIAQQQAEAAANGGRVLQAPTIGYRAGMRPDQIRAFDQQYQDVISRPNSTPEDEANVRAWTEAYYNVHNNVDPTTGNALVGGNVAITDPAQRAQLSARNRIEDAALKNDALNRQLGILGQEAQRGNQAALAEMGRLIDQQDPLNAAYVQQSRNLANQLGTARDTANRSSLDALGSYTSGLDQLNARNDAIIGQLNARYDQMAQPLDSGVSWAGDLTSQAAIADPQALAAQNAALGQLAGTAGGALDYQSQAAGAYADPKYIAMRDQGLEDLYGVSQGSKDVVVGEADPAAYAAAMDAMMQMRELSNPAVTEEENFLYEQARQAQEMEERGLSAARMSNLRRRGMAGGGAELTQNALDSQRISQNRVLSDLGAAANAQRRASEMLKAYGGMSDSLNSQANAIATGNKNRQLQALGLYQQGAEVAQQSSFDQEYKRGLAADQASRDNQSTRLSGQIAYGNQANAMQDDAFNRGMAADDMARYNRSTSLDVDMFNANFDQRERDALWGRGVDTASLGLSASNANSNNLSNKFGAQTSVANNNYQRDRDVISGHDLANQRESQGQNQQLDRRLGVQGAQVGVNNTGFNQNATVIGGAMDNNRWSSQQLAANDTAIAGQLLADRAAADTRRQAEEAQERADTTGIFGLPYIGSRKGLLTGFGAWG